METYCRYCVNCFPIGDKMYFCNLTGKMFHEKRMLKPISCKEFYEGTVDAITGKSL